MRNLKAPLTWLTRSLSGVFSFWRLQVAWRFRACSFAGFSRLAVHRDLHWITVLDQVTNTELMASPVQSGRHGVAEKSEKQTVRESAPRSRVPSMKILQSLGGVQQSSVTSLPSLVLLAPRRGF